MMKKILSILLLILACFGGQAQVSSSTNITLVLTVTNVATNGYTIQLNSGPSREWTNFVSNPANQIQITNNSTNATATNLYLAFAGYPNINPFVQVSMTGSNVLTFSSFGALTITTNGPALSATNNWCSIQLFTNVFASATALRFPTNSLGIIEQSNGAYGIFGYLNSPYLTNLSIATAAVNAALPQWSNFVNAAALAALSNHVGLLAANSTNYSSNLFVFATNYSATNTSNYFNVATNYTAIWYTNSSNYTSASSNFLYSLLLLQPTPWQDAVHDAYITNGGGELRFQAVSNGDIYMYDWNSGSAGQNFFHRHQGSGAQTLFIDSGNTSRLEIDESATGGGTTTGGTLLRSSAGNVGLQIGGGSESIQSYKPMAFNEAGGLPAVCIGTFTNFYDQEENTTTTATAVDAVSIPANVLTNNGDTITRDIFVAIPTGSGATRRLEFNIAGGTDIIDTGALIVTSGFIKASCTIVRTGASSYLYSSTILTTGSVTLTNKLASGTVSGFNSGSGWSAITALNLTLTAGSGGNTGDLQVVTDAVHFSPSSTWGYLP